MSRTLRAQLLPPAARTAVLKHRTAPRGLKFGKLPATDPRLVPSLDRHLPINLPAPPSRLDWTKPLPAQLGMMLNDRIGCCTCSAVGHAVQVMTGNATDRMVTLPDRAILAAYETVSGYDAVTGANDNGAAETDVLELWRTRGVGGHKITAWGRVDHTNPVRLAQVIDLFGYAYMGTAVPAAWEHAPAVWDVPTDPAGAQIVGGHAIIYAGYDPDYWHLISWGRRYRMTRAAHAKYVDEAYGAVSPDWIRADALAPSGVNVGGLLHDIAVLANAA